MCLWCHHFLQHFCLHVSVFSLCHLFPDCFLSCCSSLFASVFLFRYLISVFLPFCIIPIVFLSVLLSFLPLSVFLCCVFAYCPSFFVIVRVVSLPCNLPSFFPYFLFVLYCSFYLLAYSLFVIFVLCHLSRSVVFFDACRCFFNDTVLLFVFLSLCMSSFLSFVLHLFLSFCPAVFLSFVLLVQLFLSVVLMVFLSYLCRSFFLAVAFVPVSVALSLL